MSWLLGNPDTSFWSDLTALPGNLATGELSSSQKSDLVASGQKSIGSVVDNIYSHYGDQLTPEQLQTITDFATQQQQAVKADVQTLTKGECPSGQLNLGGIGLGCATFGDLASYALWAIGAIVALYLLVLFAPLGRRA